MVVTHLAGLWAYPPLPQSIGDSSVAGTENTGGTTAESSPGTQAKTDPPEESSQASSTAARQRVLLVTEGGYTVSPRCALWSVEGFDLYYSPTDTASVCVQPPDSPVLPGSSSPVPPNCAVAPDSVVYCLIGGQLTADTLAAFYYRGELQTPRVTGEAAG